MTQTNAKYEEGGNVTEPIETKGSIVPQLVADILAKT